MSVEALSIELSQAFPAGSGRTYIHVSLIDQCMKSMSWPTNMSHLRGYCRIDPAAPKYVTEHNKSVKGKRAE